MDNKYSLPNKWTVSWYDSPKCTRNVLTSRQSLPSSEEQLKEWDQLDEMDEPEEIYTRNLLSTPTRCQPLSSSTPLPRTSALLQKPYPYLNNSMDDLDYNLFIAQNCQEQSTSKFARTPPHSRKRSFLEDIPKKLELESPIKNQKLLNSFDNSMDDPEFNLILSQCCEEQSKCSKNTTNVNRKRALLNDPLTKNLDFEITLDSPKKLRIACDLNNSMDDPELNKHLSQCIQEQTKKYSMSNLQNKNSLSAESIPNTSKIS